MKTRQYSFLQLSGVYNSENHWSAWLYGRPLPLGMALPRSDLGTIARGVSRLLNEDLVGVFLVEVLCFAVAPGCEAEQRTYSPSTNKHPGASI